ncbi:unnamed protein product [Closterium sp. NIES-53]
MTFPFRRVASELLTARRPAGRASPYCPRAALLAAHHPAGHTSPRCPRTDLLAARRPALPIALPCELGRRLGRAPPHPALRASLVLTRRPACGRPIQFDTWLDELQLYLLSDSGDSVSLFVHTSGACLAPPATADSRLAHTKCAHFGQHKTTKPLYDAVVARYSCPATAALDRLILPYLFPELSAFATVEDLVTLLRTSDTSYRAALPDEFLDKNLPPMGVPPPPLPPPTRLLLLLTSLVLMMSGLLLLLVGSVAAARARVARVVAVAAGGGGGGGGGEGGGGGGRGGSGGGSGGFGGGGGGSGGSGGGGGGGSGSGGGSSGGGRGGAVQRGGSGSGHRQQQQQRQSKTPTPQQLRGWFALRGAPGGSVRCPYVNRTGGRAGQTCGKAEGDCYLCVPPNPGIEAAALGASESALPSTVPAEALHTFTLDSGASRGFFHDSTTLTPLLAPIPVRLADPSGGPVLARSSIVLPCPAGPSGSLSGLHLPSFSTNLVSTATLQDAMVTTTTPGGQRVSICTCTRTGRHLATFTRRPGSSLYTLTTEPPQVAAPAQVSASGPVASPRSSHLLLHQTLLWHHRLGHPSLPRLRGMHSCLLVSGLPRSLPPLPPSPAPPYLPCVEGRQRAAPHSSSFPRTTAPLQTLYMDVWGSARVKGQDRERYFLLAVDDYTRYTTVFPLHSKGEVLDVLIPWIRAVRLQLR